MLQTVMGWDTLLQNVRKAKKTQGKALITGNKDWMDSDSEDEEVRLCYSWQMLMSQKLQLLIRVHSTVYDCNLNSVSELRCFLNSLEH